MKESVTAAFQQQLAQRRANIYNMFKNPQDALGDDVVKAEETEELDNKPEETEDEDDEKVKKGCGDGDKVIKKEKDADESED